MLDDSPPPLSPPELSTLLVPEAPPLLPVAPPPIIEPDPAAVLDQLAPRLRVLQEEIAKVIVGQQDIIAAALYALLARGLAPQRIQRLM